jgi:hypothetical protein
VIGVKESPSAQGKPVVEGVGMLGASRKEVARRGA